MKIITKTGVLIIDPKDVLITEYFEHIAESGDKHELSIVTKESNGMTYLLVMTDRKSALQAQEEIESAKKSLKVRNKPSLDSIELTHQVSEEKTYIDGFKEGTEYALKLLDKHEA